MSLKKYADWIAKNRDVEYRVCFEEIPPVTAKHKWVGAQSIGDCVYGIPNDMGALLKHTTEGITYVGDVGNGLFKWTGGCMWHGILYCFSRTSNCLLKISLDTETIQYIPLQEYYAREHHYGGVCTKDGIIYQPPRDSDHILVWELKTEKSRSIRLACNSEEKTYRYCGSIIHPNGFVYFLPERNERAIKLNTETEEWSFIGEPLDAMVFDAKIAADGNIYGYSAVCNGILKINSETDYIEMLHKEIKPGAYGTKLGVNGHLYSIPGDGRHVWDYDPMNDSLTDMFQFSYALDAKFAGGATVRNGNIYGMPAEDNTVFCLETNVAGIEIPEDIYQEYFVDCY